MQALYTHDGRDITKKDVIDALQHIGILDGDTIFVHSDIKVFGKVAVSDRTTLLRSLVNAFQESVGPEGTVVMPTFSYSFCKKEEYDRHNTHSTVGALTEFFRVEKDVQRSVHPIFSVAAWGKHADDFMHTTKDSFGNGTALDTLRHLDGKIIFFGVDFDVCTFMHYIEQMHNVPYRFMKTFEGVIVDGESRYRDSYTYFVRPLDGTIEPDFSIIEPHLRDSGLLHETVIGNGRIMSIPAKQLYDKGMKMLDHDSYCFVPGVVAHT